VRSRQEFCNEGIWAKLLGRTTDRPDDDVREQQGRQMKGIGALGIVIGDR